MTDLHLSRLSYASTITEAYSPMEIGNILEDCRTNNPPLDVTGMLFLGNGYFFQCLEGPRSHINKLYMDIYSDARHKDVQILELKEINIRYFSEWSMKYVRSTHVADTVLKETGMRSFNPYELDGYTLNLLLEAFRNHQEHDEPHQAEKGKSSFWGMFKK